MNTRKAWLRCNDFFKVLEERNLDAINLFLDSGFDIDTYLMYRKTAISFCVLNEWYDVAELLVKRGCSLSLKSENGETPLHMAVSKSNYDLVKLLLQYRADVTSVDLFFKTALHCACERNNLKIATLLLEHMTPASLNAMDKDKRTPLFYACRYGSSSMISFLVSKGAKVNMVDSNGNTPLLHAMVNPLCTTDIVDVLLAAGADVDHCNETNETALLIAIRMCTNKSVHDNFLSVCMHLIDNGCNVNAKNRIGETVLHLAVILNNEALIRKLVNNGSHLNELNAIGFVPLYYACTKSSPSVVNLLIDAGADFKSMFRYYLGSGCTRVRYGSLEKEPDVVLKVKEQLKKVPSLSHICRTVIRQNLQKGIDKSALLLPLPPFLVKFIQLY